MNKTLTATNYGKSMYGGWYVNYMVNDGEEYTGARFKTLKELKQFVADKGIDTSRAWRIDN